MPKKLINTGTSNDSGNGDSLRSAFTKINENFNELYTLTGSSNTASEVDIKGSVFADDSTLIVDGVNGILNGNLNGNVTGNVTGDLTGNVTSTTSSSSFANLAITSTLDLTGASVSSDVNFGTNDLTGINNITIGGNLLTSAMSPLLATSSHGQNLTLAGGQSTSGDGGDAIINAGSGTGTNGKIKIGGSNTVTITIGDGSNTVDYPSGTTVDFTGATITGTSFLTSVAFADLTSKPTTIAGYGITDAISSASPAFTGAVDFTGATSVDFTGATISGTNFLTSVPAQSFASLTGKPTTIAGYGITDALALGTSSTTALAGDTALFDGAFTSLTSKPTTIAGYGITDALALGTTSTTALAGDTALFDSTTSNVAIGQSASAGAEAVAIGKGTAGVGDYAQAIGNNAGNSGQGVAAVALGSQAGETSQGTKAIAIGQYAGQTTQATNAIAIGEKAGNVEQSIECIAIGKDAGAGASVTATYVSGGVSGDPITMVVDDTTGIIAGMRITGTGFTYTLLEQQQKVLSVDNATTITIDAIANNGTPSGTLTFKSAQEFYSIAIGSSAGLTSQNAGAVALGYHAGMTAQMGAVAVGSRAGEVTQGNGGVAVGVDAGRTNQGLHGIAIGKFAGNSNQSQKGIAIGYQTGETSQGEYSIAIGERAGETNQHANSIILNASGSLLNSVQTDQFIVKPVRNAGGTHSLEYDPTTGEVTYDTIGFSGAFTDLSGKPTTLAGYGITDAANTSAETTFTADVKFDTGVEEKFATLTGSTGVTTMDCANGHIHYLTTPAGDITANFTNLGLTAEYATNLTVVIDQGNTEYEITAVQIGGAAQTIVWQGNSAPTGTANGVDSFSFTILNDGGTYVVLGQMVAFGGV